MEFTYCEPMVPIAELKWTKTRKHLHLQNAFRLAGIDECGVPFLNMQCWK